MIVISSQPCATLGANYTDQWMTTVQQYTVVVHVVHDAHNSHKIYL